MTDDTTTSLQGTIRVDEAQLQGHVDEAVRTSVEETLNGLLEAEADRLCGAERYERAPDRTDTRARHYARKLQTKAGEVTLKVPKLRTLPFETAIIELNQRIYEQIEAWRQRPITGTFPYVCLDGVSLKRSWGGEGLTGVQLIVSDACVGLVEAAAECYPKARWQRCVVHWYRNAFSTVPRGQIDRVARMLKAIHAQEDRKAALAKAKTVVTKLTAHKLRKAAGLVRDTVSETLTYYAFPSPHWRQLRTNNPLERIIREVRRRTRELLQVPGLREVDVPGRPAEAERLGADPDAHRPRRRRTPGYESRPPGRAVAMLSPQTTSPSPTSSATPFSPAGLISRDDPIAKRPPAITNVDPPWTR